MKLLVFALTPPPHHGQSYMVKLMLDGFGGDHRTGNGRRTGHGIECYHVNSALASGMDDMGRFRPGKAFALLRCCWQAIVCRYRHGVRNFYYIPAPSVKGTVLRDWLVMAVCRPFFPKLVLHWHAAGLGEWLEKPENRPLRGPSHFLLGRADLSIHLAQFTLDDVAYFKPRRSTVVSNGIPDPCPEFESSVLPERTARRKSIDQGAITTINVLFLSLCMKEKGLHDALRGVVLANAESAKLNSPRRFKLTVAGKFLNEQEERDFAALTKDLAAEAVVRYAGFLDAQHKRQALLDSDILCFPTYYYAEAQPVVLLEAMAFGLAPLVTRWRAVPELFPADYPGFVDIQAPEQVAAALDRLVRLDLAADLRRRFVDGYRIERHLDNLATALRMVED